MSPFGGDANYKINASELANIRGNRQIQKTPSTGFNIQGPVLHRRGSRRIGGQKQAPLELHEEDSDVTPVTHK